MRKTVEEASWYIDNNTIKPTKLIDVWYADVGGYPYDIQNILQKLFINDSSCILLPDSICIDGNFIDQDSKSYEELHEIKLQLIDYDFAHPWGNQETKISLPWLVSLLRKQNIKYPVILDLHSSDVINEEPTKNNSPADKIISEPTTKIKTTDDLLNAMTAPTHLMKVMCWAHNAINDNDKELYSEKQAPQKELYLKDNYSIDKSHAKHIRLVIDSHNIRSEAPTPLMEAVVKAHNYLWHTEEGQKNKYQPERLAVIHTINTSLSDRLASSILNIISPPNIKKGGLKKLNKQTSEG